MPNRYIRTVFELDGDKEYKESIRAINAEQKKYNSELEVTKTAYATSANSMDALLAKQKNYTDIIENLNKKQEAQKTHLTEAREAVEKYATQLEKLNSEHESILQTYGKTSQEFKEHSAAIEQTEKYLQRAQNAENTYTTALNKTTVELGKYSVEQEKNNGYLKEAVLRADGCATSIDEYGKEVKKVVPEQQNMNTALETLARVLIAAGIQKGFNELVDLLKDTVAASIEFESAYTGVIKTVEGTPEQLQRISDGIKKLSTEIPATTTQIAAVAEAAGQLGIETDSVLDFTEVMIKLGTTTNLSAEQAASALAKFANITKTNAADYERLGSVIVALGNNFATTESDIVNMATRLASTGEIIGLSEAQIMGVATALSSVGIEVEAGSSAISKVLKNIELAVATNSDALTDYASVAGVSAAEFSRAWGEDAVSALSMFIDGLNDTERNGKTAIEILDEMGLTEVRLSNAILALASSEGILNDAVALSNQAWIDNTALMNEAELRFGTTESKMQLLKNSTDLLKIAIGDQLNPTVNNLIGIGDGMVKGLTEWVQANEWLVPTITALTVGLGVLVGGVTVATTVIAAFNAIIALNPAGAIVVGVLALAAAITTLVVSMQDADTPANNIKKSLDGIEDSLENAQTAYKDTNESIADNIAKSNEYIDVIEELKDKEELTAVEKYKLKTAIDSLNAAIPNLRLQFNETNNSVIGYTKSLRELAKAHYDTLGIQAETQYFNSIQTAMVDTQVEMIKAEVELEKYGEQIKNLGYTMEDGSADFEKFIDEKGDWADKYKGTFDYLITGEKNLADEAFKTAQEIMSLQNSINSSNSTLGTYENQLNASADRLEELNKNIVITTDETEKATTAVGGYTKSISDATGVKREYVEQLKVEDNEVKALESDYDLLETKYSGFANTAEALGAKHEALGKVYDAQLQKSKTISGAYQEEAKRNQDLTAEKERLSKALQDNIDRIETYNESSTVSAAAQNQLRTQNEYYTKQLQEVNSELDESTGLLNGYKVGMNDAQTATIETGRELETLKGYMDEAANSSTGLATTLDENGNVIKKSVASTSSALKEQEKATKEAEKAQKDLEKAAKQAAKEQEEAIKAAVEPIDASMKEIEKSAESLIKAYESTYEAARKNFDDQLDYFKKASLQSKDTVNDIFKSMMSHTGELSQQQDMLTKALSLGFDEKFITELFDKGEEGRAALSKLIKSYDETSGRIITSDLNVTVDDFNWQFKQTKEASDSLAKTVAEMKTGFSEKAAEILDEAKLLGDGISENTEEAFVELKDRVDKVMSDLSALTKTKGEETVQGLIDGVEEKAPEAETAMSELAEDVEETFASEPQKFFENGKNIVQGLIDGVEDMKPYATGNMTVLAKALLKAFNDALEIHSPSQVMYKSGENVVQGVADGIDDNQYLVEDSMNKMADTVTSAMDRTNLSVKEARQYLLDFYNACTRFEKIDMATFERLFTDFGVFDNVNDTSLQTMDALVNMIGVDLASATVQVDRFKDAVYGLDREIMTVTDISGRMFQVGNMPGQNALVENSPVPLEIRQKWDEEYRRITDQISNMAHHQLAGQIYEEMGESVPKAIYKINTAMDELGKTTNQNLKTLQDGFTGLGNALQEDTLQKSIEFFGENMTDYRDTLEVAKDVWEIGGEAWDVYENHIKQQESVVDLQKQVNEQFARLIESGTTDTVNGMVVYNQAAIQSYNELIAKLAEAQEALIGTTAEFDKLAEAIENGTVDALYGVAEGLEENKLIIRDVLINAADTEEWGKYAAQMAAEGFTVGIYDEYGNLINAAKYFTEGIKETIETELDINSPSGVFKRYGKNSAEGYYIGLVDEMHKQLGKFKMNTPEFTATIEEYASIQTMPTPSLDNIRNNSTIVHENNRDIKVEVHLSQQPYESQYTMTQKLNQELERLFYV